MSHSTPEADRPLRVVHYLDAVREEAGGVVRAVLDVAGGLAEAGVEVELLTGDATDAPADWKKGAAGYPRVVEVSRSMTAGMRLAAADRDIVSASLKAADAVHLHTPWDRYNLAVAAEARQRDLPYVVSVHGMLDDWSMSQRGFKKRAYLAAVGRSMLHRAAKIHLTAEDERRQAMKWAPKGTACVLPLVMDLAPYHELPGPGAAQQAFPALQSAGPKLLFLSRVHPKKGVELLIEAVAEIKNRGDAATALIAGPGEDAYVDQLKDSAAAWGVGDRVHFLGMVRGDTKLSLYQACDLFVLPTSQENFGIVLTEAMACGTPVVTTRGVDIWQELEERGGVIAERTADGIVGAIDSLLADTGALTERGQRCRRDVLQWLDPEKVVAQYVELYRSVAKRS